MKTDKEKLVELLTEFGVEYRYTAHAGIQQISMEKGMKNVGGYNGFYTCFDFNYDGKFIRMGAWE